jgi:ABC-type dipeptide/oligopeptide/nickel transport system permease subunit
MTDIDDKVVAPTTGPDVWRRFAEEHQAEQTLDESRPPESARRRFLRRLRRQPLAVIAMVFMALLILIAIFAPLIAPFDPDDNNLRAVLKGPSGDHWLGTDQNGRDTLSRLIFGARVSLVAAGQAVGIALLIGLIPGLLAGYFGRWVDAAIMRVAEAIMTFPPLLLAMAIVGVLGPGLTKAMFAVGIVFAPRFARLVRGLVLSVREETYIEASHSIGTSTPRILRRHVLPNILSPLIVQISLALGFSMLAEAALSVPRARRDPAAVELGIDAAERVHEPQHEQVPGDPSGGRDHAHRARVQPDR